MLERRSCKRVHLIYYLGVFDKTTDELIGYLGDITSENAMVISEKPVEPDKDYQLEIETVSASYKGKRISVDARSIRCDSDKNLECFNCGFKFLRINPEDIDEIKEMGAKLGVDK